MSITDSERTVPVAESTGAFIARVLDQEHRAACAHAAPEEARVILRLAQAFADELERIDLGFDRLRFIETAMEESA